jgi:hypothetical protein
MFDVESIAMTKVPRNFYARSTVEQKLLLRDTWCDVCEEADLGMHSPSESEEDGVISVEGVCAKCGAKIRTQVKDDNVV